VLVVALVSLTECSSGLGPASSLINSLTSSLGLNSNQAIASAGSLLGLASEKLGSADFQKVASAVPGAEDLVKKAGDLTGLAGNFGDIGKVTSALGKLGVTPDQVVKVGSSVADFAGKAGGDSVKNLLTGVFK